MSDLVLSASSVDAYLACHYRWYLTYIEGHDTEQSVKSAVGLGVHAAAEAYYRIRMDEPEMPALAPSLFAAAHTAFDWTYLFEIGDIRDPEEDTVKMRAIGHRMVESYIEDVGATVNPVMVEQPGQILVDGVDFSFHIDVVDRQAKGDVVRDTKTKGSKPRDLAVYAFPMTGYGLGYRALSGLIEADVMIDVIMRLKRDRPYHIPYSNGGPVSKADVGAFAGRLVSVANGIARGEFEPTGLDKASWICGGCPTRFVCEPWLETT